MAICHKNYGKIHVKANICVSKMKLSCAHLSNFNNVCALSNLVSLFIKFDVRSKHAFTSFFLMFTKYAQQTKNVFAAAYSTEITV